MKVTKILFLFSHVTVIFITKKVHIKIVNFYEIKKQEGKCQQKEIMLLFQRYL